ncbi:uncharacterized protein [Blastocystis hominis]|uniref:Uncharacterized protein n=1 Tax=Blastocystis hominis TaxID=12968 RepID=D8LV84_BLAHO|nr:uncharacterized protein [Blastocystis hominis]CBK19723.2 unnamed protein product [Blastocystis hominis]|eukprot:XP_012893771.1 uncharacterized protein [Blastocystis hominis]
MEEVEKVRAERSGDEQNIDLYGEETSEILRKAMQTQDDGKEVEDPPKYLSVFLAFRAALKKERAKRGGEKKGEKEEEEEEEEGEKEGKKELKAISSESQKRKEPEKKRKGTGAKRQRKK